MTPALRPRIVAALRLGFPLSATDLQVMLWATKSAVGRELRYLLQDGLVMRDGQRRGKEGHPARLWTLSMAERVPVDYLKTLSTQEKQ